VTLHIGKLEAKGPDLRPCVLLGSKLTLLRMWMEHEMYIRTVMGSRYSKSKEGATTLNTCVGVGVALVEH